MANFKTQWSILCDARPDPTYVAWCSAGSCRVCDKGCLSKKGSGECLGFRFGVRVEDLHCCVQPVAWDVMLHGVRCSVPRRRVCFLLRQSSCATNFKASWYGS